MARVVVFLLSSSRVAWLVLALAPLALAGCSGDQDGVSRDDAFSKFLDAVKQQDVAALRGVASEILGMRTSERDATVDQIAASMQAERDSGALWADGMPGSLWVLANTREAGIDALVRRRARELEGEGGEVSNALALVLMAHSLDHWEFHHLGREALARLLTLSGDKSQRESIRLVSAIALGSVPAMDEKTFIGVVEMHLIQVAARMDKTSLLVAREARRSVRRVDGIDIGGFVAGLQSPNVRVRIVTAETLGVRGGPSGGLISALLRDGLEAEDGELRVASAGALGAVGEGDDLIHKVMEDAVDRCEVEAGEAVVWILSAWQGDDEWRTRMVRRIEESKCRAVIEARVHSVRGR